MEKRIIIVGAGIAGLSAGYYARLNGYQADIFEMHSIPGGLCTAWERKGYTFDISMHMVTGSVKSPFHHMWEEMGITQAFKFHYHPHILKVEGREEQLLFSTDRNVLEAKLLAISPEDADLIREFIRLIFGPDMMNAATLKPKELQNLGDTLKMVPSILPLAGTFRKYSKMTLQEFASKFRHPFLREAIRFIVDTPGWPMIDFPMIALAGFIRSGVTEAGVPIGGSQQVVFHIAEQFKAMGGILHLKSRVTSLVMEGDRVTGIELADGTRHEADQVIWAADGKTLIHEILQGRYMDEKIERMYKEWIPVKPMVHVMLGVDMDLSKEPNRILMEVDEPITVGGREFSWIGVLHHCFDPTMAPKGKSAVEVWYDTEYEYWEELAKNKPAYKKEKKRIADYSIGQLEKRWPGFASKVEVVDVPTPHTYVRYTGNWKGSPDGWYITPSNMRESEPRRELPGLSGLMMAGQWTAPFTGTVIAAVSGRQVVQLMCHREKRKFRTTVQ